MSLQPTDKMPWGVWYGRPMSEVDNSYLKLQYSKYKPMAPNKRGAFGNDIVKYIEEHRKDIIT
jgi:hypothetical protein